MDCSEIQVKFEYDPNHYRILRFDFDYGCNKFYDIKDALKEDLSANYNPDNYYWYIPAVDITQEIYQEIQQFIDDWGYRITSDFSFQELQQFIDTDVIISESGCINISMRYGCDGFKYYTDALRDLGAEWNGEEKIWEYTGPLNDLLMHFDGDRVYCDIEQTEIKGELNLEEFDGELMDFQEKAVRFVRQCDGRAIMSHEVGLGKTVIAIASLLDYDAFPALIVVPANVKRKWFHEFNDFAPDKDVYIMNGESSGIPDGYDVYIANYDIIIYRPDDFEDIRLGGVVVDESHSISNPDAKRTQVCHQLVKDHNPDVRLLLSATPFQNEIDELESQIDWLGQMGKFGGKTNFQQEYLNKRYAVIIACKGERYKAVKSLLHSMGAEHSGEETKYYLPLSKKGEFWDRIDSHNNLHGGCVKTFPDSQSYDVSDLSDNRDLAELNNVLNKEIMERKKKSEVKDQLPDKISNIIDVEIDYDEYLKKEEQAIEEIKQRHWDKVEQLKDELSMVEDNLEEKHGTNINHIKNKGLEGVKRLVELEQEIKSKKQRGPTIHLPLISELRQYVAKHKIPSVIDFAQQVDEQMVIFGWHKEILEEVYQKLDDAGLYYSDTPKTEREKMVRAYQNNNLKYFIGQIESAGESIELVKGSRTHIVFLEPCWNPQKIYQAEGRAHARLGDWNGIISNFFVCPDTVDGDLYDALDHKASIFDQVIDSEDPDERFDVSSVQSQVFDKMLERSS